MAISCQFILILYEGMVTKILQPRDCRQTIQICASNPTHTRWSKYIDPYFALTLDMLEFCQFRGAVPLPLGRFLAAVYSLDLWAQHGGKLSLHRAKGSGPKIFPKFWALSILFPLHNVRIQLFPPNNSLAPVPCLYHIPSPFLYSPVAVGNSGSVLVLNIFWYGILRERLWQNLRRNSIR